MKKIITTFFIIFPILFVIAKPTYAQEENFEIIENKYNAQIISINNEDIDGIKITTYELEILEGEKSGEKVEVQIDPLDESIKVKNYKVGDKVSLLSNETEDYQQYFITDHIRTNGIIILTILFVITTLLIGQRMGFQSLIGLILSTIVLLTIIIPQIEKGEHIMITSIIGSSIIAIVSIYLSHGFNRKSTIALIGTLLSIVLTLILSLLFSNILKLTGYSSEESMFLLGIDSFKVNMKELLIASLIFGGIGILDDVTVSQVSVVQELLDANQAFESFDLYKKAMNVGKDHIASMVNTLFLAYASASLPLIILLRAQEISLIDIINNEVIAEEILRTLVGSIGLVLAVPITTALAVYFYKKRNKQNTTLNIV